MRVQGTELLDSSVGLESVLFGESGSDSGAGVVVPGAWRKSGFGGIGTENLGHWQLKSLIQAVVLLRMSLSFNLSLQKKQLFRNSMLLLQPATKVR